MHITLKFIGKHNILKQHQTVAFGSARWWWRWVPAFIQIYIFIEIEHEPSHRTPSPDRHDNVSCSRSPRLNRAAWMMLRIRIGVHIYCWFTFHKRTADTLRHRTVLHISWCDVALRWRTHTHTHNECTIDYRTCERGAHTRTLFGDGTAAAAEKMRIRIQQGDQSREICSLAWYAVIVCTYHNIFICG